MNRPCEYHHGGWGTTARIQAKKSRNFYVQAGNGGTINTASQPTVAATGATPPP